MIAFERAPGRRLRSTVTVKGTGLHTGEAATLELRPAARPGWWLVARDEWWPIGSAALVSTDHRTELAVAGVRFATLEHVLAAVSGLRLDAVGIALDGPEAPAVDGSAAPWARRLSEASAPVADAREAVLTQPLEVTVADARCRLEPGDTREIDVTLDFPALERACLRAAWVDRDDFAATVADARTFAFEPWLDSLAGSGLARGGSLENAVVFASDGVVLNPDGLRSPDEPARHKLLDLVGDLARLGAPLRARVSAHRPGHALNAIVVRRLVETRPHT